MLTISSENKKALKALEAKLTVILPEDYQGHWEDVEPVSMGSAALKYAPDGKVAWDEIWDTFCDLAMAGGPPHKGVLLEPASPAEIATQPDRYREVVAEICRGVSLAAELSAEASPVLGWVRVKCESSCMAAWLVRAIVMENISVRSEDMTIDLPAGPHYRLEKEIKNVITAVAKTCHYWLYHVGRAQLREIEGLIAAMTLQSPLIQPALPADEAEVALCRSLIEKISHAIRQATGLKPSGHPYINWVGVEYPDVRSAVWVMRALVVTNVLSRREGTALFLPVNPATDPSGETVVQALIRTHGLASARHIF